MPATLAMDAATLPLGRHDARTDALRARARRLAVPAIAAAGVVLVAVIAGGPARTFAHALDRAFGADPRWVLAGFGLELASFGGYVALLWHVGGRSTPRLGLRESCQVTLAGTAATRLLPTAGAGGIALTVWALGRAGQDRATASRTLVSFLVILYSVFVAAVLVAGGLVATGVVDASGPLALSALPTALAVVVAAGALVVGVRPARVRGAGRLASGVRVAGDGVRDAVAIVRRPDVRLLGAVAWWGFDVAVLWATFHALGTPPPVAVLVLAYFVGQLCNLLPLPGTVSGGLVGVMLAFGSPAGLTVAAVLAYRAIAIWTPAPLGAVALAGLRRTVARWADEDGRDAAPQEIVRRERCDARRRRMPAALRRGRLVATR